jgi:hypothetical protein
MAHMTTLVTKLNRQVLLAVLTILTSPKFNPFFLFPYISYSSSGEGQKAAEWFEKLGYKMPYGINTADFILDLASGDVATRKLQGEGTRQHLIQCAEKYLAANPGGFRADGKELNEKTMGRELWAAAQVSWGAELFFGALASLLPYQASVHNRVEDC